MPNIELIDLLWAKTKVENGCWLRGVNNVYTPIRYNGSDWLIHRLSLCIYLKIKYKDKWTANHLCPNKNCWNPLHIYQGTQKENVEDAKTHVSNREASKVVCPKGHPYDKENTYIDPEGKRKCIICKKAARSAWYYRHKKDKKHAELH